MAALPIDLDRAARTPLATQIYRAVRDAIETGRLDPGTKLPSWNDMAAQLGVSRGTIRLAYQRLIDEQFALGAGAAGTRVARRPLPSTSASWSPDLPPLSELFSTYGAPPLPFQMGVPSQDAFPFKLWSRIAARAARRAAAVPVTYPDPRGDPQLRKEIAAYVGLARGLRCSPDQVFVTAGYSGALGLVVRALQIEGARALVEDPSFPLTRKALELTGNTVTAVAVDAEGLDVAGVRSARDAALAIVTPGQQAPLGMSMSLPRRLALLDWALRRGAWIVEDDYLSELQLTGRATPALASVDRDGRVVHVGSFSKTISPALRLGFVIAPIGLAGRFGDVCACLAPAPALPTQLAVAEFLRDGHYIRHLRRMKRLYALRRQALLEGLAQVGSEVLKVEATAGLAVIVSTAATMSDVEIAGRARSAGLAPSPLSAWCVRSPPWNGLLLGVTNLDTRKVPEYCRLLVEAAQ